MKIIDTVRERKGWKNGGNAYENTERTKRPIFCWLIMQYVCIYVCMWNFITKFYHNFFANIFNLWKVLI